MKEEKKHKYIFVSGLHRSGTSLLFQMLREQNDFSGFKDTGKPEDEGQHVQTVFKPAFSYGGPGRFGFHNEAYLDEHSPLITEANNKKLLAEWAKYWDMDKTYLLEKSPPNLIRSRYLQAVFPDSYFITILRHPLAVSFATKKWSGTNIYSLIKHWLVCYNAFEEDKSHLKNQIVLRYEDFVADPANTINRISNLLDTELRLPENIEVRTDVNAKYFAMWEKYKKSLFSKRQAKKIETELEKDINKFNYSLIQY